MDTLYLMREYVSRWVGGMNYDKYLMNRPRFRYDDKHKLLRVSHVVLEFIVTFELNCV